MQVLRNRRRGVGVRLRWATAGEWGWLGGNKRRLDRGVGRAERRRVVGFPWRAVSIWGEPRGWLWVWFPWFRRRMEKQSWLLWFPWFLWFLWRVWRAGCLVVERLRVWKVYRRRHQGENRGETPLFVVRRYRKARWFGVRIVLRVYKREKCFGVRVRLRWPRAR